MKIALVHDQLTQYGGAERVLDVLHDMFPEAPIYTTVYLKDKLPKFYNDYDIRTTFIDKLPIIRNKHKFRAPFFPFGIQSLNLKDYDLIISDTQGIAKGVKLKKNQKHISYVHTIPWFIWGLKESKGRKFSQFIGKKWDYKTAQNPNILLANSQTTHDRILKYYNRESKVVYPPVEIQKLRSFAVEEIPDKYKDILKKPYFIFIGRLEGYKGELDFAQACTNLNQNLVIIGKGTNENKLKTFSKYVILINDADDRVKAILLKNAQALFNGSIEDFGINMVEALSLGVPVIALKKGGALEIVKDGLTGVLYNEQDTESIWQTINFFIQKRFDKNKLMESSERFSREIFEQNIKEIIKSL
ncbi:MAG: glycosyltransferase [bacterium]